MRPLKAQEGGMKVKDGSGEGFGFYQDVPGVLDAVSGTISSYPGDWRWPKCLVANATC